MRLRMGFTLIEMVIVISIITMLIGGSALGYSRYQQNARDTRRQSDLEQIRAALELYRSNTVNGNYPRTSFVWNNDSTGILPLMNQNQRPPDPLPPRTYVYTALATQA